MERLHLVQQANPFAPPFHIPSKFKQYQLDQSLIMNGSLGIVRKFVSPDGSSSIAVKMFVNTFTSSERAQLVLRELNLLRTLKHENIVKFLGSYHITEYCGTHLGAVIQRGKYSMEYVKKWTRELLRALQYLHSNAVIHRNIHPFNICIDSHRKLTLIGFGTARVIDRRTNMTSARGTTSYMPLEMLVDWTVPYDEKVDIWAVSTLICEMITGRPLFDLEINRNSLKAQIQYCGSIEESALRKDLIEILRSNILHNRTVGVADIDANADSLRDFLDNTLQYDPDRRMSADRALTHNLLLAPQPWEQKLPDDANDALNILRQQILGVIATPFAHCEETNTTS